MNLPGKPDQVVGFDLKRIHRQAVFIALAAGFAGAVLLSICHSEIKVSFSLPRFAFFLFLYIFFIFSHEVLHLAGFVIWGKCKRKDLIWGVSRELGAAYAGTKKTLPNQAMKKALMLPFYLTGLLPFLLGIWLNSAGLVIVSAFLIGGAAGDFSMYFQLRKVNKEAFILDDLTAPKLYIYNQKPRQE